MPAASTFLAACAGLQRAVQIIPGGHTPRPAARPLDYHTPSHPAAYYYPAPNYYPAPYPAYHPLAPGYAYPHSPPPAYGHGRRHMHAVAHASHGLCRYAQVWDRDGWWDENGSKYPHDGWICVNGIDCPPSPSDPSDPSSPSEPTNCDSPECDTDSNSEDESEAKLQLAFAYAKVARHAAAQAKAIAVLIKLPAIAAAKAEKAARAAQAAQAAKAAKAAERAQAAAQAMAKVEAKVEAKGKTGMVARNRAKVEAAKKVEVEVEVEVVPEDRDAKGEEADEDIGYIGVEREAKLARATEISRVAMIAELANDWAALDAEIRLLGQA